MNKKLLIRKAHRYLALFVSIQLFLWSIGGLYFTLFPIKEIHGDHLKASQDIFIWENAVNAMPFEQLADYLTSFNIQLTDVKQVKLITVREKLFYKVVLAENKVVWVDALSYKKIDLMIEEKIRVLAKKLVNNAGNIVSVNWVTKTDIDSEYRGKPLPAYQIIFDGEDNLHLYLDGFTGHILSMRTDKWRIFDFMWMLHVMDYETRDNFNHFLLQFFAFLAVFTSASGLILWFISRGVRKKRNGRKTS